MNTSDCDVDAVEAVLSGRPDVAEVAVVVDGPRTVAAVVPRTHCAAADLRDDIWATVPAARLPDLVVVVPRLPRDPAGRIRAHELLRLIREEPGGCGFAAPQTATEVALATLWRQVLGRRHVAATDDFFDLGGDSITATLLLDLATEQFGVYLSFDAVLASASLHGIAEAVDRAATGAAAP